MHVGELGGVEGIRADEMGELPQSVERGRITLFQYGKKIVGIISSSTSMKQFEGKKSAYSIKMMDGSASIRARASRIAIARKQNVMEARLGEMDEGGWKVPSSRRCQKVMNRLRGQSEVSLWTSDT